ncbi:DNA-binding GntR family transcriptional regulator [Saccharopolyspora erythraea NRRL 2338]|uniref:Transcriptional regulator, GntR family n=2 Tax=Saccharopolyspora erythraea TaxID=1836 RepID=A4FL76_SACEN|nr:GntR family transcriptional regulator [Saccharopolyspora erythraea]EQD85209.1 GntR family transcriptional regulator [Saccharopolyspora erythraea D]PFG98441.1 DNA-binding GntR family transcriptional regulator [Saccharopolyspora erythraea NRRL 2338]QRK88507.1 GntR family transcriptional regulator [Saccharopolyspora erythraea]CAM04801.1 transcriptional regulator, GntR family [Saccharopolyspora erythraea NRRL 2338]
MSAVVNSPYGGSNAGQSQAERAYLTLRDLILTLRLPPGSPVQEEPLTKELGIGRTPFREAVKRLESESLIAIYPRRGSFVTEVNITDHALIADVRRRLEGHAAWRAAERATDADRAELEQLCELVADVSNEQAPIMAVDTRVHRTIHRCTHNRYLENTLGQYYNLALRIWCLFFDRLPDVTDHVGEHAELLKAVIAGDAERAEQIAVAHVDHFEHAIRDVI